MADLIWQPDSKESIIGRTYLELILNKTMKLEITDGRTLIGQFLCTDKDENIILGSCQEFSGEQIEGEQKTEEPRILGLAMVPGRHVKTMHIDMTEQVQADMDLLLHASKEEITKSTE
ncbi:N-alpha-acetyltransferase 38, NatC auxiliary subunit isoform X2 [Hydra vulgaris]|uniref:N-alpha-acetyltransferase 38, NatC auxiliary subunit isoform X2 n=1 Tax=Hydra vulgaris TaxID=6087 RepID=A0ABM4BBD6_HYDVU